MTPEVQLEKGEGKILNQNGKNTAVFKNQQGKLILLDATCTHAACQVDWNASEKTWDCPCHGSRFSPLGEVIQGPAEKPLTRISNGKN